MTKEYTNKVEGVTAIVSEQANGEFSVCLRDDESGEILPVCRRYASFGPAEDCALLWAHLVASSISISF